MSSQKDFLTKIISIAGATASDRSYSEEAWPVAMQVAQSAISFLEAKPPARVLDLACGCGAATAAMALMGFDVTGLDCTPASIDIAKRMSALKGARCQWICSDMRSIAYEAEFDFVCLRDVIFGVFEGAGEDSDMIRRIAAALRPGGRCLFEVYDKEFALRHGVEDSLYYEPKSERFMRKGPGGGDLSVRLYTLGQWTLMLSAHGLSVVRASGWKWRNDPPPPPWRANFIVAQKSLK